MTASGDMRISVVIPAYNAERYLGAAIDSILAQTVGRMEIVVVDDGSTDGTRAVAESFADRGVVVKPVPARRGIGAARNLGVTMAG
ncbi:MAG: glycosyltransferase, partial [Rhodospirillaceae bacterium]|nr:glycosyltransferase [Rhodospirillaceae bacterium]